MANQRFSLPGAHVLMWSSPLLLIVLLFTLTTTSTSTSTAPTSIARTTAPSAPSTTSAPRTTTTSPHATTTSSARPSSSATVTSDQSVAPAPAIDVATGVVEGRLDAGRAVVTVPLRGPGTWTLSSSAPLSATLRCPSVSGPVVGTVVVTGGQTCQLELTTAAPAGSTWQLTPVR